jgi:hypothetical protein
MSARDLSDPAWHHRIVEELGPGKGVVLICAVDNEEWPCSYERDRIEREEQA